MPKMISKTEHEYPYGSKRAAGESFEALPEDVFILKALGRAELEEKGEEPAVTKQRRSRRGASA